MKRTFLSLLAASLLCCVAGTFARASDLLVAMNGSGRIERFDESGKHVGTFARGFEKPNGIATGPDGNLYVTTGAIGRHGTVIRIDGQTGYGLGAFIDIPEGKPGAIRRATSIVWHGGSAFVVSCDSGQILRYDAKSGAFQGQLGTGTKGGLTQAAIQDGKLFVADWHETGIRRFDAETGKDEGFAVKREGFHPWGIAFDRGELFWTGDGNEVRRFDGKQDVTLGKPRLAQPVQVVAGPDGLLYVANLAFSHVVVIDPKDGKTVRTITDISMRSPIGLAFTTSPRREQKRAVTLASAVGDGSAPIVAPAPPLPADAKSAVKIGAEVDVAELPFLGVDTERGDRVKHNVLRSPIQVVLRGHDGTQDVHLVREPCRTDVNERSVRYTFDLRGSQFIWDVSTAAGQWQMRFSGDKLEQFAGVNVVLPLDPKTCSTSIIAGTWSKAGRFSLPAILSAPDLGQFHVTSDRDSVEGSFVGERPGWMDITFHLPKPDYRGVTLNFSPLVLPTPAGIDAEQWRQARRGWFNLFQLSAQWRYPHGGPIAPAGILANNVLSDPVSSLLWFHGDQAMLIPELAPGVRATDVVQRAVEYWLYEAIEPDGQVWYVSSTKHQMMDANPAVLIAAWCYVEVTGDVAWAKKHMPRLELLADYLAKRDIDDDGLCESVQTGNIGTKTFGDTSIDTISSGHKNAWVNALVYRAWRCLADLEKRCDRDDAAKRFDALAAKLRAAYAPAFFNPQTNLLYWWRGADGRAHDYASTLVATYAVEYGLLDDATAKKVMDAMWEKMKNVGYAQFELGIPINLSPVLRDAQYHSFGGKKEDGSDTFGRYCNGGVFPQFAVNAMTALWKVGQSDRADMMLKAMLERQDRGVFPNGGGFQNGITNVMGTGPEIYDWKGATTGYEGHCVRDCSFVMSVFLRDPTVRTRVYRPIQ